MDSAKEFFLQAPWPSASAEGEMASHQNASPFMWTAQHTTRPSSLDPSWPVFLAQMTSESLTLVGFGAEDLWKIYDALEICSKTKDIQAVEVFMRTLDEVSEGDLNRSAGLCLVRIPEPDRVAEHRLALTALSLLEVSTASAVIPVLKPSANRGQSLKMVGRLCPVYLNVSSPVQDYVTLFRAYLFAAAQGDEKPATPVQPNKRRARSIAVEDHAWM